MTWTSTVQSPGAGRVEARRPAALAERRARRPGRSRRPGTYARRASARSPTAGSKAIGQRLAGADRDRRARQPRRVRAAVGPGVGPELADDRVATLGREAGGRRRGRAGAVAPGDGASRLGGAVGGARRRRRTARRRRRSPARRRRRGRRTAAGATARRPAITRTARPTGRRDAAGASRAPPAARLGRRRAGCRCRRATRTRHGPARVAVAAPRPIGRGERSPGTRRRSGASAVSGVRPGRAPVGGHRGRRSSSRRAGRPALQLDRPVRHGVAAQPVVRARRRRP